MENEKQREISTGRKVLYMLIVLFVFAFIIEGMLSIYFYRKNGGEKTASVELFKTIKNKIAGTDKSDFIYEPWVEFRHKPTDGMVSGQFLRRSVPDGYFSAAPGDTLNIYFFGGSTMFGSNVKDNETIPSQFVELYREKLPQANPIRVHNYGSPRYYSYQELILLSDLIQRGHRPDIVVFLDGINDFHYGIPSYYRQSYFSYVFRQFFDEGLRSTGKMAFLDSANVLDKTPEHIDDTTFNNTLISNYISNMQNITMIAGLAGAKAYFFCEPSPYYHSAYNQQREQISNNVSSRFEYIYPRLSDMQDQLQSFTFLGNFSLEISQGSSTDTTAQPQSLNRKIAERILQRLENDHFSRNVVVSEPE